MSEYFLPPSTDTVMRRHARALAALKREKTTAGVGGARGFVAEWSGLVPAALGNGSERQVPFDNDGSTLNFDIFYAFARIVTPYSGATTFRLEKSAGGGAFVPTTVTTVTVAASTYDADSTGFTLSVSSGELLRIVFTAVGANCGYTLQAIAVAT